MVMRMPHWPKPLGNRPSRWSLAGINLLLSRLGNPHDRLPPVVYVGGTNGKGSTVAFIRSILNSAGYSTHVYTSPHLMHFNERVIVADQMIGDAMLYQLLEECRMHAGDIPITFFEGTTAAIFLAFSRIKADFVLLEVGCGGRLDATNVIKDALVSVITVVDYDHTNILGHNIAEIAAEKAPIMRSERVCVIGKQRHNEASNILEAYARKNRVRVFRAGQEWRCESQGLQSMEFTSGGQSVVLPRPKLEGAHQIDNSGNAIAVCSVLSSRFGYEIGYEHLVKGTQAVKWPARLENIDVGSLISTVVPDNWHLYLDGAHNLGGAEVLARWMSGKNVFLIVGMTEDRDAKAFLQILRSSAIGLCATCVHSEPCSQTSASIYKAGVAAGFDLVFDCDSIEEAMHAIVNVCLAEYLNKEFYILICGSLYLAGDVLMKSGDHAT